MLKVQPELHRNTAPWAWQLATHEATTLAAQPVTRWVHVEAGSVWLTRAKPAAGHDQAEDIWLGAGDSLALPAGSEWVLEAWPQARLSLLLQVPAAVRVGAPWAALVKLAWWRPTWLRAVAV